MLAAGRPLIAWCVAAFAAAPSVGAAVVAAPPGFEDELESVVGAAAGGGLAIEVVTGGATRAESVGRGLSRIDAELVAVHDAARPLVRPSLIESLISRLRSDRGADGVIAAEPVTDTIKRATEDGEAVASTEAREGLWRAQTPQLFRVASLRAVHAGGPAAVAGATDDASLVERAGGRVLIESAPPENLKVTTAGDLRFAESLLRESGDRR